MRVMRVYWLGHASDEFAHGKRACMLPARLLHGPLEVYDVTQYAWLNNVSRCVTCGEMIQWEATQ